MKNNHQTRLQEHLQDELLRVLFRKTRELSNSEDSKEENGKNIEYITFPSGIPINKYFNKFKDHIIENILVDNQLVLPRVKGLTLEDIVYYKEGVYRELLDYCITHKKEILLSQNKKEDLEYDNKIENLIVLTHPFYLFLTITDEEMIEHNKDHILVYLNELFNLFNLKNQNKVKNKNNEGKIKNKLIVFEMPELYPLLTSKLLEMGIVDDVIFTMYNRGYPVNNEITEEDVKGFNKELITSNNVFFGGSYLDACLLQTITYSYEHNKKLEGYLIKDAYLFSLSCPGDLKELIRGKLLDRMNTKHKEVLVDNIFITPT